MDDLKKEALRLGLNCLGLGRNIDAMEQLKDCEFLVHLIALINPNSAVPKPQNAKNRMDILEAFISKQYNVIAGDLIDFSNFNECEVAKVILLILCAAIHKKTRIFTDALVTLDPKYQIAMQEMMEKIILGDESALGQNLCEIVGMPVPANLRLLSKRAYRPPTHECPFEPKSPMQQLLESTKISQQFELRDQQKLVRQLTCELQEEKALSADYLKEVAEKDELLKIKEKDLEKVNKKLCLKEEEVTVLMPYAELCDAKDEQIQRLQNKIKELSDIASSVPSLDKEIQILIHERNELESKVVDFKQMRIEHVSQNKTIIDLEKEVKQLTDEIVKKDGELINLAACLKENNEEFMKTRKIYSEQIEDLRQQLAESGNASKMNSEENLQDVFTDKLSEMEVENSELDKKCSCLQQRLKEAEENLMMVKSAHEEQFTNLKERFRISEESYKAELQNVKLAMEKTREEFVTELQERKQCFSAEKQELETSFNEKLQMLQMEHSQVEEQFSQRIKEKDLELERIQDDKLEIKNLLNTKLASLEVLLTEANEKLLHENQKNLELEKVRLDLLQLEESLNETIRNMENVLAEREQCFSAERQQMETSFNEKLQMLQIEHSQVEERFSQENKEIGLELERIRDDKLEMENSLNTKLASLEALHAEANEKLLHENDKNLELEKVRLDQLQVEKSLHETIRNMENVLVEREQCFSAEKQQMEASLNEKLQMLRMEHAQVEEQFSQGNKEKDLELEKIQGDKLEIEKFFNEKLASLEVLHTEANEKLLHENQKNLELEKVRLDQLQVEKSLHETIRNMENVFAEREQCFSAEKQQMEASLNEKLQMLRMEHAQVEEQFLQGNKEKDLELERIQADKLEIENLLNTKLVSLEVLLTEANEKLLHENHKNLELEKVRLDQLQVEKSLNETIKNMENVLAEKEQCFSAEKQQMKATFYEKLQMIQMEHAQVQEKFSQGNKQKDLELEKIQGDKLEIEKFFSEKLASLEVLCTEANEKLLHANQKNLELEKVRLDQLQLEESLNDTIRNLENVLAERTQCFSAEKQQMEATFNEKLQILQREHSQVKEQFSQENKKKGLELERIQDDKLEMENLLNTKLASLEVLHTEVNEKLLHENQKNLELEKVRLDQHQLEESLNETIRNMENVLAEREQCFSTEKQQMETSFNEKLQMLRMERAQVEEQFSQENKEKDLELEKIKLEMFQLKESFIGKIATLENLLEEAEKKILSLQQDSDLKQALEVAESEVMKLQEKIRSRELKLESINVERKAIVSKCDYLDGKVLEQKKSEEELRKKYDCLKPILQLVTDERDTLEKLMEERDAEILTMKEFCKIKCAKLAETTSLLASKDEQVQNLTDEVVRLKTQTAHLVEKLGEKEAQLTWINVKVQNLEEQYNIMKDKQDNHEKPSCAMVPKVPKRLSLAWSKPESPRLLSPVKSVSEMNLDMMPPPPRNVPSHFASCDNLLPKEPQHKSTMPSGMGGYFACEEEEGQFLSHSYLDDLKHGKCEMLGDYDKRFSELQRRNTLCLPHLKSSYPVEVQIKPQSLYSESALKTKNEVMLEKNILGEIKTGGASARNQAPDCDVSVAQRKLKVSQATYQKPGPPTPGKNGKSGNLKTPPSLKKFLTLRRGRENYPNVQETRKNLAFSVGFSPKGKDDAKRRKK